MRIHITGASGSGTTTLGIALAAALDCPHFDSDDYFWLPTDEPYTEPRDSEERNRMLLDDLRANEDCVESGSLPRWSEEITAMFDAVVFLWIPAEVRLERLRAREQRKLGHVDEEFMEWAASYDRPGNRETRSRLLHDEWLDRLHCPVLRIEGDTTNEARCRRVLDWLRTG